MTKPAQRSTRRRFLKYSGASSLGVAATLAGCMGGDGGGGGGGGGGGDGGGGGGDGGDGGGDGGGGSNGGGGGNPEVRIAIAPLGITTLPWKYVTDNGIFKDKMEAAGYPDYNVVWTWEEAVIGASGQTDITAIGSVEAARIGPQRELEVAINSAGQVINYPGFVVEAGTPYDPAEAGSEQAAMDNLVNDGATIGIGSWAGGDIPVNQLVIKELYGYDFTEEGDFNVVSADYAALGQLLEDGQIDCADTGPPLHAPQLMETDDFDHAAIYWLPNKLVELGFLQTNLALANHISGVEFAENHEPAIRAWLEAMAEGLQWMAEQDFETIELSDDEIAALTANSIEEARFILDWTFNFYDTPVATPELELTEEYIESDKEALQKMGELGQVPENWSDFLSYNIVELE